MAQNYKLSDVLQSISNTQIRIALEQMMKIAGVNLDTRVNDDLLNDVTGDITGTLTNTDASDQRTIDIQITPTTADRQLYMDINYPSGKEAAYIIASLAATSGTVTAIRGRAQGKATGASTANIHGIHAQGIAYGSLYAGTVNALYAEAIAKTSSTVTTIRGAMIACDSEGTPASIGTMYGAHIRIKSSVAPTTFIPLVIETEKAGTGHACTAAIRIQDTTWTGAETSFDVGLDFATTGKITTGINFAGGFTTGIDFSDITYVPTGSNGPSLTRCGTYGTPLAHAVEAQSGLMRWYMETSANGTSYDRGLFICLKTTGTKSIFPVAALAEVKAQTGAGPLSCMAGQFISHLNSTTAKMPTSGATNGLFGIWVKITANDGATLASDTKAAPIWLDNQLYGANAANCNIEYGIYATTGGTVPKAFVGFETTSAGYANLFYFDTTYSTSVSPCDGGAVDTDGGDSDGSLKIDINGTAYLIPFFTA